MPAAVTRVFAYLWAPPAWPAERWQAHCEARGQALEAYCQAQGLVWQGLHTDRSLNSDPLARPVLKHCLKQMQAADVLLVQDLQDLGRRFYDVYTLMQHFHQGGHAGSLQALAQAITISQTAGADILAVLRKIPQLSPAAEADTTPQYQRSELSRQNGGACPYGYAIHPDSNEYVLVPEEARVVRQIFKLRAKGQSLRQIAQRLAHEGSRTKRGGRWHANTIKAILENPFYTGAYQTHYARFEQHHPEIISPALYYELNAHLICDDIAR
ncbi:MAG: recombinase family protein [Candidatus Sericytochromatia bacterium]|nr:recombinase family protein [Candidatus Sericytochromatia bacterium]